MFKIYPTTPFLDSLLLTNPAEDWKSLRISTTLPAVQWNLSFKPTDQRIGWQTLLNVESFILDVKIFQMKSQISDIMRR